MNREFRFRFFADEFNKIKDAPKHLVDKSSNDLAITIKIKENHHEFDQVLNWAKKHKKSSIGWFVYVDKVFSQEELDNSDALNMSWIDDAPGEMFGESYGTKYKVTKKCKQYEIFEQVSPLFCNTSKLSRKKDLQKIFSSEIIISRRLKELLEEKYLNGFEIKPIFRPTKISNRGDIDEVLSDRFRQSQDYFQLVITSNAGHISSPPTKFGPNYLDLNRKHDIISRLTECDLIENIYWDSSICLNKEYWPKVDFAVTKEKIMSEYPYPLIIISQKAYQILKENEIKGFEVEPAYFT